MVRALRQKGIQDERVLQAMTRIPRHWFVDTALLGHAYEDAALPIGCEQTISQPSTVAYQTQLLAGTPGMTVLEIGTGSAYQTAVLWALGYKVFTIERQKSLYDVAKQRFTALMSIRQGICYQPRFFLGDGYEGVTWNDFGPFDRVLVTCGAPFVPPKLLAQLKVGGSMIIPIGSGEVQSMQRIVKQDADNYLIEQYDDFRFVPMLQDVNFNH